jgi:hypothetical protein
MLADASAPFLTLAFIELIAALIPLVIFALYQTLSQIEEWRANQRREARAEKRLAAWKRRA